MKFKKGDRCRITGNSNSHKFKIGEEVEIEGEMSKEGDYVAWRLDHSNWWWVSPEDMELITEDSPDLTLMQKFEAGWVFTHEGGTTIVDMGVLKSGKIAVEWSDGMSYLFINEQKFLNCHTITPPMEKKFSLIDCEDFGVLCDHDRNTLSEAKELANSYSTCIIEHHKVDGKWVFVKAHGV